MDLTKNIFLIGRRSANEDQLTEMLAWLCEVTPEVRATIFELAGIPAPDPEAIAVRTQQRIPDGRLDGLLENDETTLILESKLPSTYQDDQLEKYCRWLAEHRPDKQRVLLTLTKIEDPWPPTATQLAADLQIEAAARRWEDMYGQLSRLAEDQHLDDISTHLITTFTAMLAAEGLIPIAPIQPDEFAAWAASATIIDRFHAYFDAAKPTFAAALDGTPSSNRMGRGPGYAWQGYQTSYGWFVYAGIWASSEKWPARPGSGGNSEPVFGAALIQPSEKRLAAGGTLAPGGWTGGPVTALYGHAGIWRPLDTVLIGSTVEQQLQCVASACAEIKSWAQEAYFAHVQSAGSTAAP